MNSKLICPKCGGKVEAYGSSCYPEDGVCVECVNDNCDYELSIKVNHIIPEGINLRLIAETVHRELWRFVNHKTLKSEL